MLLCINHATVLILYFRPDPLCRVLAIAGVHWRVRVQAGDVLLENACEGGFQCSHSSRWSELRGLLACAPESLQAARRCEGEPVPKVNLCRPCKP